MKIGVSFDEATRAKRGQVQFLDGETAEKRGERPPPPYASRSDFRFGEPGQRFAAARRLARLVILASARASRSSTRYWRMASGCDCFQTSGRGGNEGRERFVPQ